MFVSDGKGRMYFELPLIVLDAMCWMLFQEFAWLFGNFEKGHLWIISEL